MEHMVSVIIPTFKRASFLERAVNSALNQSYENIEIIIIDDNGDDSPYRQTTEALILDLYGNNDKVRYIKNAQNIGGAKSRNVAAESANGEYLCFLDDDDIYLPDKIKDQLAFMVQNKLELSFTDIKMFDSDDNLVDIRNHSRYIKSTDNSSLLKYHLMHHLTPTDTYMFQKDAFFKTGGFQTRKVSQEFMLMLESIEKGLRIGYLKGVYAVQYIHNEGRISQDNKRVVGDRELLKVKEQYYHLLTNSDVRFIKFRYHAALGVYFLRNKQIINFTKHIIAAFFISPEFFVKEAWVMLKGVKN